MSCTIRCRTTSLLDRYTNDRSSIPLRISRTTFSPECCPAGRSIWVMSPVTTALELNPNRVRNIFICSGVVFWASSSTMNESFRVLWVTRKSSVRYSESAAATWMQSVSASPAGSMRSMNRLGRPPPGGGAGPPVGDPAQRPDQEHHLVAEARRAGHVLDAAGPALLRHRSPVGVQQTLEHGQADVGGVVQVALGDELRVRERAGKPEVAEHGRHRVDDDHASTVPGRVAQHVVDRTLAAQLDAVEGRLQGE